MEVAVRAGLLAKWYMYIDSGQLYLIGCKANAIEQICVSKKSDE
jgi:hypothetical protein